MNEEDQFDGYKEQKAREEMIAAMNINTPKHTPTPVLGFDGMGINNYSDEYRGRIATFQPEYRHLGAHIVRCVNSHEALIETLKAIKTFYDEGGESLSKGAYLFQDEATVYAHIRAALKQAEGGDNG